MKASLIKLLAAAFVFSSTVPALVLAEVPRLELKDKDVWVMAGDSITAQRLHSNYIEAFYRTRYPKLNLHFRNSGIPGNRAGNLLQRFDYDVAAWKPTIVSVELGMNDVSGSLETYIKGIKELVAKIRAIPAQPVLISSSPVDDGSVMGDWKNPRCKNLHDFTEALQKLAVEEGVVFVDQYHPIIDIWGQNRRKGAELAAKNGTMPTPLNKEWREASKANDPEKLAAAQKAIEEVEAKIQAAVQPLPLEFEIEKEGGT